MEKISTAMEVSRLRKTSAEVETAQELSEENRKQKKNLWKSK